MNFEVCAVNIQSARAAALAGADRIELCSALDVGGLTPSSGLIRATVQALDIPVHVLIRPREGDFCYSETELDIMLDDIRQCREIGAAGVVLGALLPDGHLDTPKLKRMQEAAASLEVSCHRAFDFTPDVGEALEELIEMRFVRVLSSGQAENAYVGRNLLRKMVEQARGRIAVMPGAGITELNIRAIAEFTGAKDFHFTAKIKQQPESSREMTGLASWHWESDAEQIRRIRAAILGD